MKKSKFQTAKEIEIQINQLERAKEDVKMLVPTFMSGADSIRHDTIDKINTVFLSAREEAYRIIDEAIAYANRCFDEL